MACGSTTQPGMYDANLSTRHLTTGTLGVPIKMFKFNLPLLLLVSSAISMNLKEPEDFSSEEEDEEQVIDQVIDMVESGLDDGQNKEGRALFITLTLTTVSSDIFYTISN